VDPNVDLDPYDHLAPSGDDYPGGTYRVVGLPEGSVTLLCVADDDGSRANTGVVIHVPREDLDEFEPAENPDAGFSPARWVGNVVDGMVQEVRMLLPW
jgi:hypothetical protein